MRNKIAELIRRVAMIEGLAGQDLSGQDWSGDDYLILTSEELT